MDPPAKGVPDTIGEAQMDAWLFCGGPFLALPPAGRVAEITGVNIEEALKTMPMRELELSLVSLCERVRSTRRGRGCTTAVGYPLRVLLARV